MSRIPTDEEASVLRMADTTELNINFDGNVRRVARDCLSLGWLSRQSLVIHLTDAGREALDRHTAALRDAKFIPHMKPDDAESIPMLIICPSCGERHIDEGEWEIRPHHTHACQFCGMVWRPAIVNTTGVRFLPGFHNAED